MTLILSGDITLRRTWQPMDPDAAAYITAVETADGQALEEKVKIAIDNFVLGCKADGIWNAIKASCILAGARTLEGALQPLAGTAPTNYNFVAGDYNRKSGLKGNRDTKYLDSNRSDTDDPNTSGHMSVYATSVDPNSAVIGYYRVLPSISLFSYLYFWTVGTNYSLKTDSQAVNIGTQGAAFYGVNKEGAIPGKLDARLNNQDYTATFSDTPSTAVNYYVFRRNSSTPLPTASRIAFYSIGESLDLAKLDARVTDLINKFAEVIP